MTPLVSTAPLVSTEWLAAHLDAVTVVDASWYMPDDGRDPEAEFRQRHIPGAVFFDIDAIADQQTDLPHMMPTAGEFAAAVGAHQVRWQWVRGHNGHAENERVDQAAREQAELLRVRA